MITFRFEAFGVLHSNAGDICISYSEPEVYANDSLMALGDSLQTYIIVELICGILFVLALIALCWFSRRPITNYFRSVDEKMKSNPDYYTVDPT